mgnify:CR=1 FL=1
MKKVIYIFTTALVILMTQACKKDWLTPKPLSFFSPENTYTNAEGLYAAITQCEKNMRSVYFGDYARMLDQLDLSDVGAFSKGDQKQGLTDLDHYMTPTAYSFTINPSGRAGNYGNYWNEGWEGVKYANIVITRVEQATDISDEERNVIRAHGYFHRAWRYFLLIHEFGDVPWIDKEVTEPRLDFNTYDRWSILEKLEKDVKYAYETLPESAARGRANKWAAGVLYMKILMENQKFDEAIEVGKAVISAHPLQTTRLNASAKNLQLDLHCMEGKINPSNTEGIMYVNNFHGYPNDVARSYCVRNATPYWAKSSVILTPEGIPGTNVDCAEEDKETAIDNDYFYGRGAGFSRPSNYYQYTIWTSKEANDERGPANHDSWVHMEDMYYNVKSAGSWYGKHLVRPVLSAADSLQCWFSWPYYKLWVPDPTVLRNRNGGETPWYVYRTAEVYLLMAECYYWKGDLDKEKEYINPVRVRAGATPLTMVKGISEVLSERARELYYEELRHDELVRISYMYAKSGKICEVFNRQYSLDKFSGNGGDGENLKEYGYNFYWDWVNTYNGIFNRGIVLGKYGEYLLSVHHVLWPIPETSITSNTKGTINETPGYVTA